MGEDSGSHHEERIEQHQPGERRNWIEPNPKASITNAAATASRSTTTVKMPAF